MEHRAIAFSPRENLSLAIGRLEDGSCDLADAIKQLGNEPEKMAVLERLDGIIQTVREWRNALTD